MARSKLDGQEAGCGSLTLLLMASRSASWSAADVHGASP